MVIEFSPKCWKLLKNIKRNNPSLFTKFRKQLKLFQQTPNHPSLRLHKLSGKQDHIWSISIDQSIRMLFYFRQSNNAKGVVFFTIGKHEEVYS